MNISLQVHLFSRLRLKLLTNLHVVLFHTITNIRVTDYFTKVIELAGLVETAGIIHSSKPSKVTELKLTQLKVMGHLPFQNPPPAYSP
jgi:hypothetical protein